MTREQIIVEDEFTNAAEEVVTRAMVAFPFLAENDVTRKLADGLLTAVRHYEVIAARRLVAPTPNSPEIPDSSTVGLTREEIDEVRAALRGVKMHDTNFVSCAEHKRLYRAVASIIDRLTTAQQGKGGEKCHGLDTPDRVRFYEHDFYVLSNFSAFRLEWKGLTFDTSEVAYHWEKFQGDADIQHLIITAPSSHEAFKCAGEWKDRRRKDWDDVKIGIMRDILRAKVHQHEYVRRKLLATGDRELVEDSWRDDFWGWGPNRDGKNMLGKLWMEVRVELRSAPTPEGEK